MKRNIFPRVALAVSLSGFLIFYMLPFFVSLCYGFVDNPIRRRFVGLQNFTELLQNPFFLRGASNMVLFMMGALPVSFVFSLILALVLKRLSSKGDIVAVLFLVPYVLPSAAVVRFWMDMADRGAWLYRHPMLLIILIYGWKNMGYLAVLFLTGLYSIPEEYDQYARVLGANGWQRFWYITWVYLRPATWVVWIMSLVNSFKIFKETYLMWGDYPPKEVYLLQHFVNSTLLSLHYQKLVCAVYLLAAVIVCLVAAGVYEIQRTREQL